MLNRFDKGVLIALDGIDGAGKTTQAERLCSLLRETGLTVVRTKEPTDGRWGRKLRESALSGRLSVEQELDYFLKDRQEHVDTLIAPALADGKIVIVDRYYFSTVAYQGARGLDPHELLRMNEVFAPRPDLLVLIDISPELSMRRIRHRGGKENLFEAEENLRAVASVFRQMNFDFLMRVDGAVGIDDITSTILGRLYSGLLSTRHLRPGDTKLTKGQDEPANDDVWFALARLAKQPRR